MINPEQHILVAAALLVLVAGGVAVEHTRAGRLLPTPAVVLIATIALANLGVLPHKAAAYEQIARVVVPVGVFLLLLRADIRRIFRETGALLRLYLVGAVSSGLGILAAYWLAPVPEPAEIAAVQLANLVGGTVNVIAVAQAVDLDPSRFTAMMAGAAAVMNLYYVAIGAAAGNARLKQWLPEPPRSVAESSADSEGFDKADAAPFSLLALASMIAAAVLTFGIADVLVRQAGRPELLIVVVSGVALVVANLGAPLVARASGDRELGTLLMYVFFATLGAGVDLRQFGQEAASMAMFIALAIAIHLIMLLLAGRCLRASLSEVLVASVAGIGGPSTAAAMAASFGRRALITPGVLCGLLGFATATFAALAMFALIKA